MVVNKPDAVSPAKTLWLHRIIQAWTRKQETFLLEVMMGKQHGVRAAVARVLLWGSSKVYRVAVALRRTLG